MTATTLKSNIRKKVLAKRRALSQKVRFQAAKKICQLVVHAPPFQKAHRIGAFMAYGSEVDPAEIVLKAHAFNKGCYMPILHPQHPGRLRFAKVDFHTRFVKNRFGIDEPKVSADKWIAPWELDLVLMPLVAFDAMGHRLGMGGGYYDRAFHCRKFMTKPYLMGLAFECQRLDYVPHLQHDVTCDAIVSEKRFYL